MNMRYIVASLYIALSIPTTGWGMERIVSLAPSNTSILLELGLKDKLIGITKQCNLPGHPHVEIIGEFAAINKEKVLSLNPDLVLSSDGIQETVSDQLTQLGLRVEIISTNTIDAILESIMHIGTWTGREKQAAEVVNNIQQILLSVDDIVSDIPYEQRPTIFVEMWNNPLSTAGKQSFVHEMIVRAGGINIARTIDEKYPRINPEWVITENPEIIIIGYQFEGYRGEWKQLLQKRPGWKHSAAVVHNEIHDEIPPEYFLQPGPQVAEGIRMFNRIILDVIKKREKQ